LKNFKITLPAKKDSLAKVISLIEEFAEKYSIPPKTLFNLQLIAEEIIVNICSYAYPDKEKGEFSIELSILNGDILIIFKDSGIEFDPTTIEADTKQSVHNATIGGLGIHIVKELAKKIEYIREGNENILKILI